MEFASFTSFFIFKRADLLLTTNELPRPKADCCRCNTPLFARPRTDTDANRVAY